MSNEILNKIGEAAALEQLAEECTELAQSALKLARKIRGENPTPKSLEECKASLLAGRSGGCGIVHRHSPGRLHRLDRIQQNHRTETDALGYTAGKQGGKK